jgi:HSP20 family protein
MTKLAKVGRPYNLVTHFGDMLREFDDMIPRWWQDEGLEKYLRPRTDIKETEKEYIFRCDMPGIEKDNIEVRLDSGILCISGERKEEKKDESSGYLRIGRNYTGFQESYSLPENIDPESLKAKYKDGVLELTIQKLEKPKPEPKKVAIE